jgi:lactate dehydrogenase-like 2-hydroxyacid dehydrogenase
MAELTVKTHPTLFVTDRPPIHQQLARDAAPEGLELTMLVSPTRGEVLEALSGMEFFISERSGVIDADHFRAGSDLRLVQRFGSQVHDIDTAAAAEAGVPVCSWPLAQSTLVAEHVMMQILGLLKRVREGSEIIAAADPWGDGPQRTDANTFNMNWSGLAGIRQIQQSTVGILGFGEIGTELALRLQPFDCEVLYHRRNRLPESAERRLGVRYTPLAELLAESDTLCCLLPHTEQTESSVDAAFIAQMKPGAMLVNSGASTTLDEAAVAAAYQSGQLGGVAADGHRWEPVRPNDPLVVLARDRSANVLLTPHTAQGNVKLTAELRVIEFTNLVSVLEGRPLQHRLI